MRIEVGLEDAPAEARAIALRKMLRYVAVGRPFSSPRGGRYKLEALDQVPEPIAYAFRPRLREETRLGHGSVVRGPFRISLDPFDVALLERSTGLLCLGEIAILANNATPLRAGDDPLRRAIALVATMAKFDMLETGAQQP